MAEQTKPWHLTTFTKYLSDELIPFVDENYRTEPFKILVGHSFGGEYAAYALLNYPQLFNAHIAISPYMMYDDDFVVKQAKTKLKADYPNGVQFYMTIGDEPDYFESLSTFETIIKTKSPKGLDFLYVKMEDESHGSIPHLSIYNGLQWIYSGWRLTDETLKKGLIAVDDHYKELSIKYGYKINTPEYVINILGYNYLRKEQFDEAIKVFHENVKRFPTSANVYDSLGEAYEKNGQYKKAENNYRKAVEIGTKENHQLLKAFTENLNRAQKSLTNK